MPDWRVWEQLCRRDWQLRLMKTEMPDWRVLEQLGSRGWQQILMKTEMPVWRVREQLSVRGWPLRLMKTEIQTGEAWEERTVGSWDCSREGTLCSSKTVEFSWSDRITEFPQCTNCSEQFSHVRSEEKSTLFHRSSRKSLPALNDCACNCSTSCTSMLFAQARPHASVTSIVSTINTLRF